MYQRYARLTVAMSMDCIHVPCGIDLVMALIMLLLNVQFANPPTGLWTPPSTLALLVTLACESQHFH